jgi:hypothetical protein
MIRKLLNSLFHAYRLKLVPLKQDFEPIHLQPPHSSPLCINYLANRQAVVLAVPLEKGRALPLFTLSKKSAHPYVMAIRRAATAAEPKNTIRQTLMDYYQAFRPRSAASMVGLPKAHPLHNEPYWAVVLPWASDTVDQRKTRIQKSVAWENKMNGLKIGIDEGWAWAGPVSKEKLELETERLFRIFTSIRGKGYARNDSEDGDIQATALFREDGEWVWQARVGQHRAAVVAGLMYEKVPVRFTKIVYRNEVQHWPNVLLGLYSREEALRVFDMVFAGNYPSEAINWHTKEVNNAHATLYTPAK